MPLGLLLSHISLGLQEDLLLLSFLPFLFTYFFLSVRLLLFQNFFRFSSFAPSLGMVLGVAYSEHVLVKAFNFNITLA